MYIVLHLKKGNLLVKNILDNAKYMEIKTDLRYYELQCCGLNSYFVFEDIMRSSFICHSGGFSPINKTEGINGSNIGLIEVRHEGFNNQSHRGYIPVSGEL